MERKRRYTRHGLTAPRTKLRLRGMAALDRRTATAKTLLAAREELERDLGGRENLSAQERVLVDAASREMAYLDHVDGYLMGLRSVVDRKRRVLVPAFVQRGAVVDRLARLLGQLGLERRVKTVDPWSLLAKRPPPAPAGSSPGPGTASSSGASSSGAAS